MRYLYNILIILTLSACNSEDVEESTALGSSWDWKLTSVSEDLNGIAFGIGKFVAVGNSNGTNPRIIYSYDANIWFLDTTFDTDTNMNLNSVAYNGVDTFMAVGDVGDYYTSSNGVSWTKQTTLSNTPNLKKIIYANSQFVAVGTDYICSGTTQLSCTNEVGAFNDITYNGSTFVAVGEAGLIFTSSTGTHNDFSKPWFTSGIDSLDILSIGVFDNTFYLSTNGTSSQQSLYSSSDGSTWTKIISENFNTFALIQADDILIGGSTAGSFSYTRDFTTHKTSAYDVAGSVNDLIFTSKIVSVGDSGLVLVSE